MTPLEYAEKYKRLEVFLPNEPVPASGTSMPSGTWRTVTVKSYRLGEDGHSKNDFMRKVRPYINEKDERITVWIKTARGAIDAADHRQLRACAGISAGCG